MTVGEVFAGVGGFGLGLERAGMCVLWHAEIDPYASAVLRKHWPHVPNHGDVRNVRSGAVESVDLICGGFPCQDISVAGRGRGLEGERSGLWREFRRIVGDLRPRVALVENVGALTARGLAEILGDLAALGYDAEWHVIPAAAVDAPHVRDRVWIIATDADGERCSAERVAQYSDEQSAPGDFPYGLVEDGRRQGAPVADSTRERIQRHGTAGLEITFAPRLARLLGRDDAGSYWQDWPTQSPLCGSDDGLPHWAHRMRVLGLAVVPQIAEIIGRAIIEREGMTA